MKKKLHSIDNFGYFYTPMIGKWQKVKNSNLCYLMVKKMNF